MAEPAWRNRIVEHDEVDASTLVAHPGNARVHNNPQRAALGAVLADVGWVAPVVVNRTSGLIVDGHLRVDEAAKRGEKVPVVYVELTDQEEAEILATLDPIGQMATYDLNALSALLELGNVDSEALLSMLDEVAGLEREAVETQPEDDEIPEPPAEPISKTGDVWILRSEDGRVNRIACGDSTNPVLLEHVMDGTKIRALITDPPYGVDYGDTVEFRRTLGKTQRATENSAVKNDGLYDALALWDAVFPLITPHMGPRSAFYCWSPPGDQQSDLCIALRNAGLQTHGSVIWRKSSFSFSRAEHKYQHEPCWYGWTAKGVHDWFGPNNETTIWEYDKPQSSEFHPTQKPVDLIRRCVSNITGQADHIVFDPFLGSGTTLIASEIEKRTCYGIEMSPSYVDVIVSRWQGLTGIMPKLESTGEIHDFIASGVGPGRSA